MKESKIYSLSDEYKCYLWTPLKTASYHATFIFNHYSFKNVYDAWDENAYRHESQEILHHHTCDVLPRHYDYDVICTARHPLKRIISYYNYRYGKIYQNPSDHFEYFVYEQILLDDNHPINIGMVYGNKIPNYFIKTESLYEDYLKIPFIKDSKLATSGILEELCNKRFNKKHYRTNIENYYNYDMIDRLYDKYRDYYELLGYSKEI